MPKVLLIGKDERIQDLKGLKDYLAKLIANSDKEGVKELVKRIETLELQEFLISWKKTSIADEIKKAGDIKSALKILFKSMIDRDFPDELIEENGCANLIGEDKGIDEILLMGGRVELKAGNYIIKGDGVLQIDKDIEIIGDGRGRSNIRLDKDLEITNKARIKISHCTIRSDDGNEMVIKIIGGEVEFEDINFVGVGVKIDGGCKLRIKNNLFEKVKTNIDKINGEVEDLGENKFEKKESISFELNQPIKNRKILDLAFFGIDSDINKKINIKDNRAILDGENKKLKFKDKGHMEVNGDNVVIRNLDIEYEGDNNNFVIKVNAQDFLIENCKIKGGIIFDKNSSGEIRNCEIYDNIIEYPLLFYPVVKLLFLKRIIEESITKVSNIRERNPNEVNNLPKVVEVVGEKIMDDIANIMDNTLGILGSILIYKSKILIKDSRIYRTGGIDILKDSKLEIRNVELFDNHKSQINVFNSECKIYDSFIYKGEDHGIYSKNSKIEINSSKIYENRIYGVLYLDSNVLHNENEIYMNKASGIAIDGEKSEIKISGDKIYKNKNYGIMIKDRGTKLNMTNVNTYGNERAGISFPRGRFVYYKQNCRFSDGSGQ